jgi:hypothetical protein
MGSFDLCSSRHLHAPPEREQVSIPADQCLLRGLLRGRLVGAFNEFAVLESGAGAHQCDQVRGVDRAGLGGFDELVGHRDSGRASTRSFGGLGSVAHGRESRLDGIGSSEMPPVLGREVVEREQLVQVVDDLGDRLGNFAP